MNSVPATGVLAEILESRTVRHPDGRAIPVVANIYVFTDVFHADKLLDQGGVVGFNNCGWRPVYKVLRFFAAYRRYRELDVGLPKVYRGRNPLFSLIKRIEGRSTLDRYFEKVEQWEPEHGFHRRF